MIQGLGERCSIVGGELIGCTGLGRLIRVRAAIVGVLMAGGESSPARPVLMLQPSGIVVNFCPACGVRIPG